MLLQRHLTLSEESARDVATLVSHQIALDVLVGLGQAQTEDNQKHRRACAEPVQWAPAVRGSVDEAARKGSCQEVAKGVALLEHT